MFKATVAYRWFYLRVKTNLQIQERYSPWTIYTALEQKREAA